jgi:cytochrome c peroxidase
MTHFKINGPLPARPRRGEPVTAIGFKWIAALAAAAALAGCGGGTGGAPAAPDETPLSAQARLGELIFRDVSLSASGRQSCASCHASETGDAGPNALAAQSGGALLDQPGRRSSPSIRYLSTNTAFHFDAEGTPTGGFFWDGRAVSLQDQASRPFVAAHEMANADVAAVVAKLLRASYAAQLPLSGRLNSARPFISAAVSVARPAVNASNLLVKGANSGSSCW